MFVQKTIGRIRVDEDTNMRIFSKWLLFVLLTTTVAAFFTLPNTIPVHFNSLGEPDRWGGKMTILVFPVIVFCIYLLLQKLKRYPQRFNYQVQITSANAKNEYGKAVRILSYLQVSLMILAIVLTALTWLTAVGRMPGLSRWFLPFAVLLLIAPTAVGLVRIFKRK